MAEQEDRAGVVAGTNAPAASLEVARRNRMSRRMGELTQRRTMRRIKAVELRLEGKTYAEIAAELGIARQTAQDLITRSLSGAENRNAEQMRVVENARLDAAQAAIWSKVLAGDLKAVETFLRIAARRAKLNGLDAPTEINLSLEVRQEMESALKALEAAVLGSELGVGAVPDPWDARDGTVYDPLPLPPGR